MNQAEQARLLYTLLDAADDERRLRDPAIADKWGALKERFNNGCCEQEAALLYAMLDHLDRTGALELSWIQARWRATKTRIAGGAAWLNGLRCGPLSEEDN